MIIKAVVLAAAVAALSAPLAHADSSDDAFVSRLNGAGVPGNRSAEIAIAHESCDLITAPKMGWGPISPPAKVLLVKIRNELLDQGVEPGTQMRAFEQATNDVYCPDLSSSFFTS